MSEWVSDPVPFECLQKPMAWLRHLWAKNVSEHKCNPEVLVAGASLSRMRAWEWKELPINKMAYNRLSLSGYSQICVARGSLSWGSKDNNDAAGELELWYDERDSDYCLYARKTARHNIVVCKVVDVFILHFQKCTDKIKTLLTKESKFHFVQYCMKTISTMWEWTDKEDSSGAQE